MRVITLKQPWATLVAMGIKNIEFRSWKTNYRGKILIHAGSGIDKEELKKFSGLGYSSAKKDNAISQSKKKGSTVVSGKLSFWNYEFNE